MSRKKYASRKKKPLQFFNVTVNGVEHILPATSRHAAIKQAKRTEEFLKKEQERKEKKNEQ